MFFMTETNLLRCFKAMKITNCPPFPKLGAERIIPFAVKNKKTPVLFHTGVFLE
jgi:hypothetical protein